MAKYQFEFDTDKIGGGIREVGRGVGAFFSGLAAKSPLKVTIVRTPKEAPVEASAEETGSSVEE